MTNVETLLAEAGASVEHVVTCTVYLTDIRHREPVYRVLGRAPQGGLPGVHRPGRVRPRPARMAGRGHRGSGEAMTFSLVGRCERTGAVGAVIASASMAVAARCVAARAGVGAVCSQSTTDPRLREALLAAMAGGLARRRCARGAGRPHRGHRVPAAGGRRRGGRFGRPTPANRRWARRPTSARAGAAAAGNLLADRGVPAAMLAAFGDSAATAWATGSSPPCGPGWTRAARSPRCGRPGWSSPSRCRGRSPTCGLTGTTTRWRSSPGSGSAGSRRQRPTSAGAAPGTDSRRSC